MPSDQLLLAVRYLSNELPGDELAAFESLLAHDQAAREAVAEAVELTVAISCLAAPAPDRLPMPTRRRAIRPLRLGAAVAAGLACAVGLAIQFGRPGDSPSASVPTVSGPAQPEAVALAWSGLRQSGEVDLVSHTELLAWLDEPMAVVASPEVQPSASAALEDELLPRWLLEATSLGEASGSSGADTGTTEN